MSIDFITQKAGYKRGTYYLHRKKESLSLDILKKYEKGLGNDFSEDIPEMAQFIVEEEDHIYKKEPATLKEALKEIDHWKDKYYELMEKYQRLLEGK